MINAWRIQQIEGSRSNRCRETIGEDNIMNLTSLQSCMEWITDWGFWQWVVNILAVISFLSIAIDRLKSILELKPDLKVEEIEYTRFDKTSRGELGIKVKNYGDLLATNVCCIWAISRKDTNESIEDSTQMPFGLGIIGPGKICTRSLNVGFGLNTSEPHEIWISLVCTERIHKPRKHLLKINVSPPPGLKAHA